MQNTTYRRVLQRAAEILGGEEALRAHLDVPEVRLHFWLDGSLTPPDEIFFRLVDLIMDAEDASKVEKPQQASRNAGNDAR